VQEKHTTPLYTIGITADLIKVCPATLRIWEKKGLIKPARLGKNRFYSRCDIDRLKEIKDMIQKKKINIQGVKKILSTTNCWEIKYCEEEEKKICPVYIRYRRS
jgi:MerR family transcriptional regulator/heat shock protein HspR